jgi:nucleotide-binding universal stress UspA family protein
LLIAGEPAGQSGHDGTGHPERPERAMAAMAGASLETIAVGFDGSDAARAALRWALAVARPLRARVVVIHATGLLEHVASDPPAARLQEAVSLLAGEAGLEADRVRWQVVDGDPCSVLLRAIGPPLSADLLVVGSRGHTAHRGLTLGSTSHELAQQTSIPLVIVPAEAVRSTPPADPG